MSLWFPKDREGLQSTAQDPLGRVVEFRKYTPPDPDKPLEIKFVWETRKFSLRVKGVSITGQTPEEVLAQVPETLHLQLKKAGMSPKVTSTIVREEIHEVAPADAEKMRQKLGATSFFSPY